MSFVCIDWGLSVSSATVRSPVEESAVGIPAARLADYWQMLKPRIATMAMVAVAVGYVLGSRGDIQFGALASACFGILCVAVSCSLLNQWLEQDTDAQMERTADRPVPGGRIRPGEVLVLGLITGSLGITWLWFTANVLTAMLAAITLAVYVCAYTPLKRVSPLCTAIGAVAGALPPVLGWTAAGGVLDFGALSLFLFLFAWQFPHFLAIATIHRRDYERAGLKMLPILRTGKSCAGIVGVVYAIVLIPVSLLVWQQDLVGSLYVAVALTGGCVYLASSLRFMLDQSIVRARELLLCSIVYLPTLLLTMTWEHCRLLA